MTKRNVFYSFHYDNDVFRVQQIRNMGRIYGNTPVSVNDWENLKRGGDLTIKKWINYEISKCSCVVVLIGKETFSRSWVLYEISEAWRQQKGLLGIYIHNLNDITTGKCSKGLNPFSLLSINKAGQQIKLSEFVRCYDPRPENAYNDIYINLPSLVEDAIIYRYRMAGGRL